MSNWIPINNSSSFNIWIYNLPECYMILFPFDSSEEVPYKHWYIKLSLNTDTIRRKCLKSNHELQYLF